MLTYERFKESMSLMVDKAGSAKIEPEHLLMCETPFVSAGLTARSSHAEASAVCARFAELAVRCEAYLTMVVHFDYCFVQLQITRAPLEQELATAYANRFANRDV